MKMKKFFFSENVFFSSLSQDLSRTLVMLVWQVYWKTLNHTPRSLVTHKDDYAKCFSIRLRKGMSLLVFVIFQ